MQTDAMDQDFPIDGTQRGVFVVETHGLPLVAFEAGNRLHAEELVRSRKLTRAIDRFCVEKCAASLSHYTLRTATASEASLYANVATEFADPSPHLLLAYLPGLSV